MTTTPRSQEDVTRLIEKRRTEEAARIYRALRGMKPAPKKGDRVSLAEAIHGLFEKRLLP